MKHLTQEKMLPLIWLITGVYHFYGEHWLADSGHGWFTNFTLILIFLTILVSAIQVVRHAERLAHMLGEPLGTLVLTMSVTMMEVSIIVAMMMSGDNNEALARDATFAVIMIVLNGLVGVTLLVGGWRHREQFYNLQGVNSFLAIILPLSVISLVLPNYTKATSSGTFSVGQEMFLVVAILALYGVFLMAQTMRHRTYFTHPGGKIVTEEQAKVAAETGQPLKTAGFLLHATLLLLYLLPVVILSEHLAIPAEETIQRLGAPAALAGILIAILVLSPESISGFKAALDNQLQRSVNIYLGSVTATIGLTIPAVLLVSMMTGQSLVLGLETAEVVLLILTLAVSILTFITGRTNIVLGAVHLVLFGCYLVLVFD